MARSSLVSIPWPDAWPLPSRGGFAALGLYREQAYADNGGHQRVTSVFEG